MSAVLVCDSKTDSASLQFSFLFQNRTYVRTLDYSPILDIELLKAVCHTRLWIYISMHGVFSLTRRKIFSLYICTISDAPPRAHEHAMSYHLAELEGSQFVVSFPMLL